MEHPSWTLDQLVRLVELVLAGLGESGDGPAGGYPGPPNGRVRELPDRRVVRWYATIGLVDRPVTGRGRVARYGPRQLRQLVAIKRRQAQGWNLADIQRELAGASDQTLAELADLPESVIAGWSDQRPDPAADPAADRRPATADRRPATARRFWATASDPPRANREVAAAGAPAAASAESCFGASQLTAVPLAGGAVLLVPGSLTALELAAIAASGKPLNDLLEALATGQPAPAIRPADPQPAPTPPERPSTEQGSPS